MTSYTPSLNAIEYNAYYQARDQHAEFPGYFGVNMIEFPNFSTTNTNGSIIFHNERINAVLLNPEEDLHHAQSYNGFKGEVSFSAKLKKMIKGLPKDKQKYVEGGVVMHFFDADTFRRIFEKAGFIVEDIYYFSGYSIKKPHELTDKLREQDTWQIGIKVSKPNICAPKPALAKPEAKE